MKILNLVQGSPEWFAARKDFYTASEAVAMMGASKHITRNQLLDHKKGWITIVDEFTQRIFDEGHAAEESAREIIELDTFTDMPAIVGTLEVEGLPMLASLDGYFEDDNEPWEHKLHNKILAENVVNNILGPQHYWQLEHQLLVCGGTRSMFTCSDGTEERAVSMYYESVPERREDLIAGWKQFDIDLANHEVKAKEEKLVANKIAKLPSLQVSLVGQVSNSNLAEFKGTALNFIEAIKTELSTDQDFKDANEAVKWLKDGEDELESVKERALSDTADIKLLFETINDLKSKMRDKRLILTKLSTSEKKRIRENILQKANADLTAHINEENKSILPILFSSVAFVNADFSGAMKGKSTVDSLQNAVDTVMASAKIEVNEIIEKIKINLESLRALAEKYEFLFNDTPQLVLKDNDDLVNLIKTRITDHKAEKEKELVAQTEAIRLEEERKAKIVKVLMPSGIREFDDITIAANVAQSANGYLEHDEDGSVVFKLNQVKQVRTRVALKSNNTDLSSQASEQSQNEKSPTSVGMEAAPTQKAPIEQRLAKRFSSAPVNNNKAPARNKAEMMRQLNFWKNEYGVRDTEFNDLLCIINQHAYCEEQNSNAA